MLRSALALAALALLACPMAGQERARSNVLLLIADDLGVDGVGVYGEGAAPPPTPHIDALAARGVLFRNAWANPVCSATRAQIYTGRHAHRTFVGAITRGGQLGLEAEDFILPELLDAGGSGYAHALIGKWHLGGNEERPNRAGWSHFAGFLAGQVNYFNWRRVVNGSAAQVSRYATTQIVDDAVAWIEQQRGPWFCCVAFSAPHTPIHAPPPELHTRTLPGTSPEVDPIPFFKAMVEAMDTEIGRLLDELGPEVVATTDVIFVADNGAGGWAVEPPFVPAHGKGSPYEGGVNVPLIVAGPSVARAGREEGALVAAIDLFATVAELAGVSVEAVLPRWLADNDSRSLVPLLAGDPGAGRRPTVFAERFLGNQWTSSQADGFACVRGERFKLIRRFDVVDVAVADELYDLIADPFETNDLMQGALSPAARAAHTAMAEEITRRRLPRGAIVSFGSSACASSGGLVRTRATGNAAIGAGYTLLLEHAPAQSPAWLLTGSSAAAWGNWTLPFDLSQFGAPPGCLLLSAGDVVTPTQTDAAGSGAVSVPLPFAPALVGQTLFHTWLVAELPGWSPNALGLVSGNAVAVTVGVH